MILDPQYAGSVLIQAGMPRNRVAEFVAIGICESGLDTEARSPVGALGLWQIMPANFPGLGLDVTQWDTAFINARAAVLLSGGGSNCAAWDTAYRNIYASGRYTFLNWPEPGSCAWSHLGQAAVASGHASSGGMNPPADPAVTDQLAAAIATYDKLGGQVMPSIITTQHQLGQRAARMYQRKKH